MSSAAPQYNTTLSLTELEALIRRAVKEAVHEEFARVLRQPPPRSSRIGHTKVPAIPPVTSWCWPKRSQSAIVIGPTRRRGWRGRLKKEMRGNLLARITADPAVLVGKPVIPGMRISVAQIVTAVAAGVPQSELLEDYPGLEPDDIQAALLYAANLVEEVRVYPVLQPA